MLLVPVLVLAMVLVGLPVVLAVRGAIELGRWLLGP
jgi:hypothetical protein